MSTIPIPPKETGVTGISIDPQNAGNLGLQTILKLAEEVDARLTYQRENDKRVAKIEANQKAITSDLQATSQKVNQALEAIDRRDKFLPIIPEIEKLGVSIPEAMRAQVGKECKLIAKSLGDNPKSRLKEGIGRFDVITYPRELVGPIARTWFAIHRNNVGRANWFKKLWKINAPFAVKEETSPHQIQEAKDLILESLAKGPQESNKILDQMDKKGIPNQVWIEAKSQLGVVVKQASNGRLIWSLPKK